VSRGVAAVPLVVAPKIEPIIRSAYEIAPTLEQAGRSFNRPRRKPGAALAPDSLPGSPGLGQKRLCCSPETQRPLVPSISLKAFEGGHAAFLEDPDNFEQVLRGFLNQICPV
jgi:hypothetical protein